MYINRQIVDFIKKSNKSVLLLGPRQTGKSTLFKSFKPDLKINLANQNEFLSFSANPKELEERLGRPRGRFTIFIDEVQRIPSLLNTVQAIVDDNPDIRFFLTGSSARKLKRGQANLLPGRIHVFYLGPLSCSELNYSMDSNQILSTGSLPGIYLEPEESSRHKTLQSYSATYLKEEIQAEALTRNLEGFARFLYVAAESTTEFVDFTKIASQAQVSRQSVSRFFEILEDTLIVHKSLPFSNSKRRRLLKHPRFYFFDNGVLNALLKNHTVSRDRVGRLFENMMYSQIQTSAYAKDIEIDISSYRTEHGAEVDYICEISGEIYAIEAKPSKNVGKSDLTGLRSFSDFYKKPARKIIAYLGETRKQIEDVEVLPWQDAIREMGL